MTESINPYKAPKSDLKTEQHLGSSESYFFTASTLKLVLMSVCTLGLYELYWFYKNWVLIKNREDSTIMPVWRTIFAPFWGFVAFEVVKKAAVERNIKTNLSAGWLGLAYLLISIVANGPDPIWLISTFSFVPLMLFNSLAIEVAASVDPSYKQNDNFSPWNVLAIVLGGILMILLVVTTLYVDVLDEIPL